MLRKNSYVSGWLDLSIHDFVETISTPSRSIAYTLITRLDGSPELRSIVKRWRELQIASLRNYKFIGKGLCLSTERLVNMNREHRIFYGFDEVWFFSNRGAEPKPLDVNICGPDRITSASLSKMVMWMQTNHCTLGLGDGVGMNVCANVRGAGSDLLGSLMSLDEVPHSTDVEQPDQPHRGA